MRRLTTLLAPFLLVFSAKAQGDAKTLGRLLFSAPSDTITGGYVTLTGKGGQVMDDQAFFLGTRIGATVGHWFSFGVMYTGMTNSMRNPAYELHRDVAELPRMDGLVFRTGYGGLFVEPVLFHRSVVHLAFPIAFGAGGAAYSYPKPASQNEGRIRTDVATFFFVEPGVELEVNIVRNVRFGIGGSYLFTNDIRLPATGRRILEQPYLQCSLKIGVF